MTAPQINASFNHQAARFAWSLSYAHCPNLRRINREDHVAREFILAEAAEILKRFETVMVLDYCWALESAAQKYLRMHAAPPKFQSEILN